MERREMCGVFFTTHDREDEDGFDIEIDNPTDKAVSVGVNLRGSTNLMINSKECSHNIQVSSDLTADVMVPANTGRKQIILPVDVVDDESELALALEVTPGPKVDTIKEPCGTVSYVRSLPDLKGFEFSIDNPTSKAFDWVRVTFTTENTSIKPGPGAIATGNVITYKGVGPQKRGILIARLATISKDKPISCRYTLDAQEAAPKEPEVVDTKVLSNGSVIEVVQLPDDGGFEFWISNPTDGPLSYAVDFGGSQNLKIDAMPPGERASETVVKADKVPGGAKRLVVARLTSIDPKAEDALAYSVESTGWKKTSTTTTTAGPAGASRTTRKAPVAMPKPDGASGSSASESSTKKSKTGLVGRPGRVEVNTLKCGMVVTQTLLENLAGYTLDVSNPTAQGYKMMVDFTKTDNVTVVSEGTGVQKSDTTVMIEVPPGSERLIIAALPSITKGKSIAMEYASKVAALK